MEVQQGNSLYTYLKQAKMPFFSYTKLKNRRAEQVLHVVVGTSERRRRWGNAERE
jgi:hypothetical protein